MKCCFFCSAGHIVVILLFSFKVPCWLQDCAAANGRLEAARRAVLGCGRGLSSQGGVRPHSAKAGYAGAGSSMQQHNDDRARQLSDDGSSSSGTGEYACLMPALP